MATIKSFISKASHKKPLLALLATLLLLAAVIAIAIATTTTRHNKPSSSLSASHAIVKSSCSSTLYPSLCFSSLATSPSSTNLTSFKDVITLSLNITIDAVEHNFFTIEKLIKKLVKSLTKRERCALHDCLEMIDETLDELHEALRDLLSYPSSNRSLMAHADDLKTLISSAITNQETCLDGFSHDQADKRVRKSLEKGQKYVEKLCSNALAMIKNMTDNDIANEMKLTSSTTNRKLKEEHNSDGWPEWLSAADRHLLQSSTVTPNVIVAADGSGKYKTVSEAVAAAPSKSSTRYVIRIKAGVYNENVDVPKGKTNIMFLGDGRKTTIITGSRNVVDGDTTFNSATVAAVGAGFLAREITLRIIRNVFVTGSLASIDHALEKLKQKCGNDKNKTPEIFYVGKPQRGKTNGATLRGNSLSPDPRSTIAYQDSLYVHFRVGSDLSAFYRCDIIAYQDSLYVHSNRQFFEGCFIAGTVDFIFGNAAVVLQNCDIHARKPNSGQKNMLTAQDRTDPNQNTGIVIQKSRIGATSDLQAVKGSFKTYLGRPWKEYSRTVIMQSSITDVIDPVGWSEWSGTFALNTLFYSEYANTGAGAATSKRVAWKGYKVITSSTEAQAYTPGKFIAGGSWLSATGFPFVLGL